MQFRTRPVVFAVAAALGTALTVPGALALASSTSPAPSAPSVTDKTTASTVEEQHEAQMAEDHEAPRSEQLGTTEDKSGDTADATETETEHETDAVADHPQGSTNVPGATGDAHRSDVAAQHSQADQHRAVAPGVPAHETGQPQAAKPSATTHGHAADHTGH